MFFTWIPTYVTDPTTTPWQEESCLIRPQLAMVRHDSVNDHYTVTPSGNRIMPLHKDALPSIYDSHQSVKADTASKQRGQNELNPCNTHTEVHKSHTHPISDRPPHWRPKTQLGQCQNACRVTAHLNYSLVAVCGGNKMGAEWVMSSRTATSTCESAIPCIPYNKASWMSSSLLLEWRQWEPTSRLWGNVCSRM